MPNHHSVFISYAHKDTNTDRVTGFTQFLHDCLPNKVKLLFDRKFLGIGKNIPDYMERLELCPVAIVLFTPAYKWQTENATGGVFTEYEILRRRFTDKDDDIIILCVLFDGSKLTSIPNIFLNEMYEDFTQFHPRKNKVGDKYFMSDQIREEFIPKLKEIADAIESKIPVRLALDNETHEELLDQLFARTKITREWLKLHPEFSKNLFVPTRSYERVKKQTAVFLIGRKGSGKSTVANTLPELEHERYKISIPVLADQINLLSTFEFVDHEKLNSSITAINQRFRAHASEYTQLNPAQFLFKYAWLGLLYICLAKEINTLGKANELNTRQRPYFESFNTEFEKFTFRQSDNIEASKYFTFASVAFSEFWDSAVTCALKLDHFSDVVRYLDSNVNEESYLNYLLTSHLLIDLRKIVEHCDRHALITLDDFDSVFSMFRERLKNVKLKNAAENESTTIESAWIQSLMILILELKGYRKGWHDIVFHKLDFCITIPQDAYTSAIDSDRDAYLNIECTADLEWSGVYLAQILLKRLCFMYNEEVEPKEDVFSALNRVVRTYVPKLPTSLTFDYNGNSVVIDLFCYVLRHTFWRPRDLLTYYAALMTSAISCTDQTELTVGQVRRIVGATTRKIVKTEFDGEFKDVITNLPQIQNQFQRSQQVLDYSQIYQKLEPVDFVLNPKGLVSDFDEKLKVLYEIGFLGLILPDEFVLAERLNTRECFYFNEGSSIFNTVAQDSLGKCSFLIHPIFVEKLLINHTKNDFMLNWTDEYLRENHVVRASFIDAYAGAAQ